LPPDESKSTPEPHPNDGLVFLARQREGVEHLGEALLEKVERLVEGQHLCVKRKKEEKQFVSARSPHNRQYCSGVCVWHTCFWTICVVTS
jgi:hypothetical protein